jgi:CubicO group peptidase (beta-lactamase class C family)
MTKLLFFLMNRAAILLVLLASSCIAQESSIVEDTTYDFAALDRLLRQEAPKNSGIALVLMKDGEIIYDKGFSGFTSDTVVPIASASKWLSAAVIMALVDEGVLSLDDKASDYLDLYAGSRGEMTVRQMFSHTSGLPGHYSSTGIPGSDDILGNKTITLAESVDMIARVELLSEPGTQFYYGGLSMQVAGRIAEVASRKEWRELFEEKVASPLEMKETDYNGLGPTCNPRIAGSIQTSAHQYAKFLQMLLSGGVYKGKQILSQDVIDEMLKDQTCGVPIVHSPWQQYEGMSPVAKEVRYGIGCWREVVDETEALKEASSQGAFGFSPWIDVDRNVAGVLAVRSRLTKLMPVYLEMKEVIRRIIDQNMKAQNLSEDVGDHTVTVLHDPEYGLFTIEVIEYYVHNESRKKRTAAMHHIPW